MIGSPLQSPTERALAVISIMVMIALAAVIAAQFARDRSGLSRAERSARNWNFLIVGLLAFTAGDLLPDLATETEAVHRLDEVAIIFIAFAVVGWYLRGERRFTISIVPLVAGALALLAKLGGVVLEIDKQADVEGDVILVAIMAPLLVFFVITTVRRKVIADANQ